MAWYHKGRKVAPNEPCPCGSGRKFKKCHRDIGIVDPTSAEHENKASALFDGLAAEQRRRNRFGHVTPIIHTKVPGQRLVAEGSRIYIVDERDSFKDFLRDRLREALGEEWWRDQLVKPVLARHPVARWQAHADELMRAEQPDERGQYSIPRDGPLTAYLTLAYDLYVVRHNIPYQKRLVDRLRSHSDFSGIRYELRVAAIFVRAGYVVEPEDESDGSTRHPEFMATDPQTGLRLAVEAKARNRRQNDRTPETTGVYDLIEDAARKAPASAPFVLFVNVAMAPGERDASPKWMDEVDGHMKTIVARHQGASPFDLVFFTNMPEEYGTVADPDPSSQYVAWIPSKTRLPPKTLTALDVALRQSGHIPDFDSDS